MYHDILVPTDGSEGSQRAAEEAINLAVTFDAALHSISVVETNVGPEAGIVGIFDALEEAGEQAINEIIRHAESSGVGTVEGSVAQGTPHQAILDYIDDNGIDLVVMGTHGRTGLDRYLLGSVTEKVVRLSEAPVLTVRVPAESAAESS